MKIPIKKYAMDESASWEERYRQLEAHHQEETEWMAAEIRRLEQPPYAREPRTKAEEIDRMIAEGAEFPIRKINGLEIRGLLGDIVKDVEIAPTNEENVFKVRAVIVARCVESGISWREVILDTPRAVIDPGAIPEGVTVEQFVTAGILKHLLEHEVHEDLRVDGKRVYSALHTY